MSNGSSAKRSRLLRFGLPIVILGVLAGIIGWNRQALKDAWDQHLQANRIDGVASPNTAASRPTKRPLFVLVPDKPDTIRLIDRDVSDLGIHVHTISADPPPNKLRLTGTLSLDPNRFVRVHSRFPGEVRRVGTAAGTNRPLRFGDKVTAGQLLVKMWSKDIGEKKSELVDALSKVHFDKIILDRLNSVKGGVVTERAINDAERNYQGDLVAVAKAERTLRSWNLSEEEIAAVHREAKDLLDGTVSITDDGHWAEMEVTAAQSGIIVEKDFSVGDMVDTNKDLFKIADLDRLQVLANVFEEDLPLLRRLSPDEQIWSLQLESESLDNVITGKFDQIGMIIDPNMHTSVVMGFVDNPNKSLAIGQFITATIEVPGDSSQVVIPVSAVIEEGASSAVFVETSAEFHEYTRRRVAVTRRGRTQIHVVSEPNAKQLERGIQPLRPGERILIDSVVELEAELNDLASSSKH